MGMLSRGHAPSSSDGVVKCGLVDTMRCNRRSMSCVRARAQARRAVPAFTLIELMVCLVVVAVLTGLLMPALKHVREVSQRINCASNMRQIGNAITAYAQINNDRVPPSVHAEPHSREPQELMVASRGPAVGSLVAAPSWDSLGWLVQGQYIGNCECFYCPSHHGEHPYQRYIDAYQTPDDVRIYTNYHYVGHFNAEGRRVDLTAGHDLLLLTDGLRTQSDFNHRNGCNRLFADISTDWWFDAGNTVRNSLPTAPVPVAEQMETFDEAWDELADPLK